MIAGAAAGIAVGGIVGSIVGLLTALFAAGWSLGGGLVGFSVGCIIGCGVGAAGGFVIALFYLLIPDRLFGATAGAIIGGITGYSLNTSLVAMVSLSPMLPTMAAFAGTVAGYVLCTLFLRMDAE